MNLDSLSTALSHISYSVANLTKKNFKGSVQEISRLIAQYGLEAERHLLRCLFSHVDFSGDGKSSGKDFHQTQYLIQECSSLINKPTFVSLICSAIENPLPHQKSLKPSSQLLPQLGKVLKLNRVQEVVFGIAFLSSNSELKPLALQFVRQKFPDLLRSYIDADSTSAEGGLQDCSPEVLHFLLDHLLFTSKDKFGIGAEQKEAFLKALKKDFPRDRVPSILSPILYYHSPEFTMETMGSDSTTLAKTTENTIAEMFREVGYDFTLSVEDFKNNLMQMGFMEITPTIVARIITMMVLSHTGLGDSVPLQNLNSGVGGNSSIWSDASASKEKSGDGNNQIATSWNVDVFVKVVQEMNPNLEWKEVVGELDHPGFCVRDRQGLQLLWRVLTAGCGHEPFPVSQLYRHWRHTEAQLSLFQQAVAYCDVVFLLDYPCCTVAVDALKAPPEDDQKPIATWKNLDLIEVLLYLSDKGHYTPVQEMFKFPVQHCPDLLILGLLQLSSPINHLRKELITTLMPNFLGTHPNSAIILHNAWHNQTHSNLLKPIMMQAMAEWYMRGECDQARLSRILDVAQDLKALSLLLNLSHFPFTIDLACLASRREYLKLDKWINDKIKEHGETFVQACIAFLKRRCPKIFGLKEEPLSKCAMLLPETVSTILCNLHPLATPNVGLSQETIEAILTMTSNSSSLLSKSRLGPPGVMKPPRIEPSFPITGGAFGAVTTLDPLVSLGTSVSNMSLNSSGTSGTTGGVGTVSGGAGGSFALSSFANVTSGSPSKLLATTVGTTSMPPAALSSQLSISQFANTQLGDMSSIFPEMPTVISKEVEDEANSYFQRIYNRPPNSTLSIDDVLELLKRYKDSSIQREREVFICMIRNLFEEYRFFPHYPDKELLTTAQLFGGIIEHQLITFVSLGLALRYVLDALRKPPNTKMYFFGTTALERFKHRLKDYPQYCQHLASIPHFSEFPANLIEYVEYGIQSQEPPSSRSTAANIPCLAPGFGMPGLMGRTSLASTTIAAVTQPSVSKPSATVTNSKPSIANATNIDTLLVATEKDDKIVIPPENVQDKIAFIINNLSLMNLAQKTEEFKEVVKEEYLPWVAQYIVMKRASIEANFHCLYSNFLDTLKIDNLSKLVLSESFRNIKVLLRSDKGVSNFSDRSLLKNLGHWLGVLTLAKNKPILQIDIDIKSLLIEAYHKGQQELLYVVPFVAKVLESTAKSKVFKPPNPWTMGIMKVLAELHREPDLKLNLKFEIEVLCKSLSLDVNELKPGDILKNTEILSRVEPQLSQVSTGGNNNKPAVGPPVSIPTPQPVVATSHVSQTPASASAMLAGTEESLASMMGATTPTSVGGGSTPISTSAQPQFSFQDINALTSATLPQFININPQIPLFQTHPHLKQCVNQAINRAISEWMQPVVDRSLKIAVATSEQIIKKDFALEPDETKMRMAAHHLVRNLTAGVAMITCRDPLMLSISTNFKLNAANGLRSYSSIQKDAVEQAATIITQENVEIACGYIQKTAVDRALQEFDKRVQQEYEMRKLARLEGRRYCDANVLTYQAERMPEPIRLKVGGVTPQQMMIYEEIGRNVPGFLPSSDHGFMSKHLGAPADICYPGNFVLSSGGYADDTGGGQGLLEKLIADLEQYLHTFPPSSSHHQTISGLIETIVLARNTRDLVAALSVLQKVVESLLESLSSVPDPDSALRLRDAHILALKALSDQRLFGPHWTSKQVTRILIDSRDEYRFNLDAFDALLRIHLITVPTYDLHLAQVIENGLNYVAINFAMQLVKFYLVDEKGIINETDLANTVDVLFRLAASPRPIHENLPQFVDMLRMVIGEHTFADRAPGGPLAMLYSGISQARDLDDPPQLQEKTEFILREWISLYQAAGHSPRDNKNAFGLIVNQMNLQGILKTDDHISRFFRISLELCVDLCFRTLADQSLTPGMARGKCFNILDAYVKLVALLVKNSGDSLSGSTKLNLLHKILGVFAGVLMTDHEYKLAEFQQLPYHRILIMLFLEIHVPEPPYEALGCQIVSAFCHTLYCLRPQKVPGFAYSWLELLSHRLVLGRVLGSNHQQKNWIIYSQLIISLFKFLAPFLRNVELPKPIQLLYKGTLKVLLVLLHDFPEFLCDYHYSFCDIIPANCIQMRNLILSAFPRSMRLPDPFTPNLKVDLLPEIAQSPRILASYATLIQPASFKKELDSYLKSRSPVTFLSELRSHVQVSAEPGSKYNVALINALVLYVGTQAIALLQAKGQTPSMSNITHSSHMDIFQNLAVDLDTEGRYLFLNAIANQLRYPNSHTHYFSCTLLYLFAETNTEAIQEQITRVLLERLIVNRPHPWGLLVTFIELIKNPTFKFWNHEFVRCAPEIEKLFESVARSCMQQKPTSETTNS